MGEACLSQMRTCRDVYDEQGFVNEKRDKQGFVNEKRDKMTIRGVQSGSHSSGQ
jgi:hypothetical protein